MVLVRVYVISLSLPLLPSTKSASVLCRVAQTRFHLDNLDGRRYRGQPSTEDRRLFFFSLSSRLLAVLYWRFLSMTSSVCTCAAVGRCAVLRVCLSVYRSISAFHVPCYYHTTLHLFFFQVFLKRCLSLPHTCDAALFDHTGRASSVWTCLHAFIWMKDLHLASFFSVLSSSHVLLRLIPI